MARRLGTGLVPVVQTDFIFSAIGEQFGSAGGGSFTISFLVLMGLAESVHMRRYL